MSSQPQAPKAIALPTPNIFSPIKYLVLSMRPLQWTKNCFILAPLFFGKSFTDGDLLLHVMAGFFAFCMASSSVYLLNDILDLEKDSNHPQKKNRPIAAGLLSVRTAALAAAILSAGALVVAYRLDLVFLWILLAYFVNNLLYSLGFKKLVILDILLISLGFMLRVYAGSVLGAAPASDWLILCTLTLSLFLGFSKRRQELILIGSDANRHRQVLDQYSISFLDQMISVSTATTVISYALYTVSHETVSYFGTRNLVFTVPFVLFGIFRYLYLTYHRESGDNPSDVILSDGPFLLNGLVWVLAVFVIVY